MNVRDISKYQGIIPTFYAYYNDKGTISPERVEELTRYMVHEGVKSLYVGGFSGEYIYQSVSERKLVLEYVVKAAERKLTIIAHVDCSNTAGNMELAAHAQGLDVDAIASVSPIYFHLPGCAIAEYQNDISSAAPDTDFAIYNIPQLVGVALTTPLFHEVLRNPRVMAVKSSPMSVQDIQMFKMDSDEGFVVFNGPDEQLVSGLTMGADGGIGGTYGVMPELYIRIMELVEAEGIPKTRDIQDVIDEIIYKMYSCRGNLYAIMKEILNIREGLRLGSVRKPISGLVDNDTPCAKGCADMIDEAIERYR